MPTLTPAERLDEIDHLVTLSTNISTAILNAKDADEIERLNGKYQVTSEWIVDHLTMLRLRHGVTLAALAGKED